MNDLRIEMMHYLDSLRVDGRTNMFGATPYLMRKFKLTEADALDILIEWMYSYVLRSANDELNENFPID